MAVIEITHFTDPACPFAFSAEPVRWRLRWVFGDQLSWHTRLIALTREPGEAERLAEGAPNLQRIHGMPIDPAPYPRVASSEPACRAVVACRVHAPEAVEPLLRRLRIRVMAGGLVDEPALLAAAASDVGLDPTRLASWCSEQAVADELERDVAAARSPASAARSLDHKLGGPRHERRYTAPSYELRRLDGAASAVVPGFNPYEAYDTAIANLAAELERRPKPSSVTEVLAWAGEPLATVEIAAVAQLDLAPTRAALARVGRCHPTGADAYWTLAAHE